MRKELTVEVLVTMKVTVDTEVTLELAVLVTVGVTSKVTVEVTVVVAIGILRQAQALDTALDWKAARNPGSFPALASTSLSLALAGAM
jgi:hypothetical protein